MKKTIISILVLAALVSPAAAKVRARVKSAHIPYMQNPAIDHSKDVAFSAGQGAQSPSSNADFTLGAATPSISPVAGKTLYYSYELNGTTVYGRYANANMNATYLGQPSPAWDGPEKNRYRNIRAYNESEPLPPNSGSGK